MRIEIRSDSVLIEGYVNVTGKESRILPSPKGRFIEQIVPKTFERALMKAKNVDLLYNHRQDRKLGSLTEGNLTLVEDNIGLKGTAIVYDQEIIDKARKNELRGWSFSFSCLKDSWEDRADGIQRRMVEDINLYEVSLLDVCPAYVGTSIEARGDESVIEETRNEEFTPTIEDKTGDIEKDKEEEKEEEKRENPSPSYFSWLDNELTILQLKGSLNK